MPPEQLQNKLKTCSDIYALGMTAIQALTGVSPDQLPTDSHNEVVWQNQAHVSGKLARILNKMVRFKSGERYQSAQEVLNDLNDINGWWWRKFVKLLPVLVILGVVNIGLIYFVHTRLQRFQAEEFYNKGIGLTERGDDEGASAAYNEAINIDSNFTEALVNQGYAYGQLNIFTEQFHSCRQATKIDDKAYGAWLCLGNAQYASKQYQDLFQYFDKVISLACYSTNAVGFCSDAWNNKGESLLKLQQPEEARKAFEKAIQEKPDNYVAWTNKGEILLNTSPQEALKAFAQALKIKPDYQRAIKGRKKALSR